MLVRAFIGKPMAIRVADYAEPKTYRVNFLTQMLLLFLFGRFGRWGRFGRFRRNSRIYSFFPLFCNHGLFRLGIRWSRFFYNRFSFLALLLYLSKLRPRFRFGVALAGLVWLSVFQNNRDM